MPPADPSPILSRRLIHHGRKFDFEQVTYTSASGKPLTREVVRHPGAVVIVPILDGSRLVMIRNRRIAVGATLLEFTAGTLEPPEPPEGCARRELIEETGYSAATLHPLGWFYTTPGLTDEKMHAFVATGLTHVGQHLEEDESITVEILPIADALRMADCGDLLDGKSIVALFLALRRGHLGPTSR